MSAAQPAQSVMHPAGADAAVIADLAWLVFAGGTVIFVGVMLLLALSLRHRRRPVRPVWWIAGAGIAFPSLVLLALLAWSTLRSAELTQTHSQDALVISVTGKMWWWEVRYRDPVTGRDIVLANEIHMPVGRDVYFALSSDDVIHSFWVPALAGKIDMVPGHITRLRAAIDRPGVYRGQCAEYCGAQHARMALHVVAEPPAQFDAWLVQQAKGATEPANALLQRGRDAFAEQRCNACHSIRDKYISSTGPAGPDLTHVGSRLYLAAGTLPNQPGAMRGWIADPQHIKPGARMPAPAGLDAATLDALASYLESLK